MWTTRGESSTATSTSSWRCRLITIPVKVFYAIENPFCSTTSTLPRSPPDCVRHLVLLRPDLDPRPHWQPLLRLHSRKGQQLRGESGLRELGTGCGGNFGFPLSSHTPLGQQSKVQRSNIGLDLFLSRNPCDYDVPRPK